mgnify:CR=1 FL=1
MNSRKGIILAGGKGSRLNPITTAISKQLLPIYDKPMIYYPLSTLMLSGIRDYLIITNPEHLNIFKMLLGDGERLGIKIKYAIQASPEGIAQALLIAESYFKGHSTALILGDNLFHGSELTKKLMKACSNEKGATIFAYPVSDPERYGVIEFDSLGNPKEILEKPISAKSRYAITGIYFYDKNAFKKAKKLKPSLRGELEISSLNQLYLEENSLNVELMGRGMAWLDTGTIDSLQEAGEYVKSLEKRQGLKVGSPEEIAWRNGWINDTDLIAIAESMKNSEYGKYLKEISNHEKLMF